MPILKGEGRIAIGKRGSTEKENTWPNTSSTAIGKDLQGRVEKAGGMQ